MLQKLGFNVTDQTDGETLLKNLECAILAAQLEKARVDRITNAVQAMVCEGRLTGAEQPMALARAIADETFLEELRMRRPAPQHSVAPDSAADLAYFERLSRSRLAQASGRKPREPYVGVDPGKRPQVWVTEAY